MNDAIIEIIGTTPTTITATNEARRHRDDLLLSSRSIVSVNSAQEANLAANALKDLKGFTNKIEAGRTTAKAPILDLGKRIDTLAKELSVVLETEATRISRTLGVWQAEQNRLAEEARKKAWQEEQRIREEAEAIARAAEDKARADAEELRRKESVARTQAKADEYAAINAARQETARKEQEARDLETERQIVASRVAASAVAIEKPQGIAVRKEMKFEVTDIVALYEAAPYLVSLTPNTAAIKSALKGLQGGQSLPGVRHWEESVSIVR